MSRSRGEVGGRRFVVALYVLIVAFAGGAGVGFASVVENPDPPALFFLLPLPPTAVGFAVYGAVTVAVVLGVPLALVTAVSAYAVEDGADDRRDGRPTGGTDDAGGASDERPGE